jgi:hypothetical protein
MQLEKMTELKRNTQQCKGIWAEKQSNTLSFNQHMMARDTMNVELIEFLFPS